MAGRRRCHCVRCGRSYGVIRSWTVNPRTMRRISPVRTGCPDYCGRCAKDELDNMSPEQLGKQIGINTRV